MHAIIFADRDGHELSPLNQYYVPAMLPILGKPVLEYALERVVNLKVREITIILGDQGGAIKDYFETGLRWSIPIRYVTSAKNETPANVMRRLGRRGSDTVLVLRGDVLHQPDDLSDFWLINAQWAQADEIKELGNKHWYHQLPEQQAPQGYSRFSRLDTLKSYHQAVMEWASDNHRTFESVGKAPIDLGIRANACPIVLESGLLHVGHYSRISDSSRCKGNVVIGQYCMIERGVKIQDSLVMDHTFVGDSLEIRNAIVLPDRIIRIDLDADFEIQDRFLIAPTLSRHNPRVTPIRDKFIAVLLILTVCPLWLIQCVLRWQSFQQLRLRQITLDGNTESFTTLSFDPTSGLAPSLPRLLGVLQGHLKLFGRLPTHSLQETDAPHISSDPAPWTTVYETIPYGCYSLAQLALSRRTERNQLELMEIEMHRQTSNTRSYPLRLLLHSLVSRILKVCRLRTQVPKKNQL